MANIGVIRSRTGTVTDGSKTYTLAGFGTPTAAMIRYKSGVAADDVLTTGVDINDCVAFFDGTTLISSTQNVHPDVIESERRHVQATNTYLNPRDQANESSGGVPTFVTDGITIPHTALGDMLDAEIEITLFKGYGYHVGTQAFPNGQTTYSAAPSGAWNGMIWATNGRHNFALNTTASRNFGAVIKTGPSTTKHRSLWTFDENGKATVTRRVRVDDANLILNSSAGGGDFGTIEQFTSTGFDVFVDTGFQNQLLFLLIDTGPDVLELDTVLSPGAATAQQYGTGTKAAAIGAHSSQDLLNNDGTLATRSSGGTCIYTATADEGGFCLGLFNEDGSATQNMSGYTDAVAINQKGTGDFRENYADITDWSNGITLDWTTSSRQTYGWVLLFQGLGVTVHLAAGTGTFDGLTSGDIDALSVGQPAGTGTFDGLTSGDIDALSVGQPAGTGTFAGLTDGNILAAVALPLSTTAVIGTTGTANDPARPYTVAGFGTPDACMVTWNRTTDLLKDGAAPGEIFNQAFFLSDGVNHRYLAVSTDDGTAAASGAGMRILGNDRVYANAANTSNQSWGTVPAGGIFIPDGIQIDHNTLDNIDGHIQAYLWKGGKVHVGNFTAPLAAAGAKPYTGAGFQPTGGIFLNIGGASRYDQPATNDTCVGMGVALEKSGTIDHQHTGYWFDNVSSSQFTEHRNTGFGGIAFTSAVIHKIDSFDADGFTMSTVAGDFATDYIFLLFQVDEDLVELVEMQTPPSIAAIKTWGTLNPVSSAITSQTAVTTPDTKVSSGIESQGVAWHVGREVTGNPDAIGSTAIISVEGANPRHVYSTVAPDELVYHFNASNAANSGDLQQDAFMDGIEGDLGWIGGGINLDYVSNDTLGVGWALLWKDDAGGSASGTGTFNGLTAGDITKVVILAPAGTGTFNGLSDGVIDGISVGQPAGTGTFNGLTSGDIDSLAVGQPAGTGTFNGLTQGNVTKAGINAPAGTGTFNGLTQGGVSAFPIHRPAGTAGFAGLTQGNVTAAGATFPSGTATFLGASTGDVLRFAIWQPEGTGTFDGLTDGDILSVNIWIVGGTGIFNGLTDGRIGGGAGVVTDKRTCVVEGENRLAAIVAEYRRCTVTEA